MNWLKKLYITPAMKKKKTKIIWKLDHGAGVTGVYLLLIPYTKANQLEIMNAAYLKQRFLRKQNMTVVGMAESYEQAVLLLQQIVEEVYTKTGTANIRSFFDINRKESETK